MSGHAYSPLVLAKLQTRRPNSAGERHGLAQPSVMDRIMSAQKINWPVFAEEWARSTLRDPGQHFRYRQRRLCPCCGFEGLFVSGNWRRNAEKRCPNCSSRPRDRFLALILEDTGCELAEKSILHIAPEWPLFRRLAKYPGYVGGDIINRRNANAKIDITDINAPPASFDYLICNHVLEYVPNHLQAVRECTRVLKDDGLAFFPSPLM